MQNKIEVLEEVANAPFNTLLYWCQLMAYQLIAKKTILPVQKVTLKSVTFGLK